jgi:two-component system chemotaxis response regulator CheB
MNTDMADRLLPQPEIRSSEPVKVLIVDDSAFMRFSITQSLNEHPGIKVIGSAHNGKDALRLIPELQPEVITLDVEMPQMDGLTTLRQIMAEFPRPVIMFSSLTREGTAETIQALMFGAVDFIAKPTNQMDIRRAMKDMIVKIMCAAKAKVKPVSAPPWTRPATLQVDLREKQIHPYQKRAPVVLIGSSTGGPGALNEIIPALSSNLPAPVLIVQHMPAGFTRSLSERLNSISPLKVKEAETGDSLMAGQVLIAPGGFHMTLDEEERITLNQKAAVHGVRPAVDVTLTSLVQRFGKNVIAVILTGMGSDGAHGASLLHCDGGYVIAEDESTCVVWGMPRSVVEAGAANVVLPRPQIASAIERMTQKMSNHGVR